MARHPHLLSLCSSLLLLSRLALSTPVPAPLVANAYNEGTGAINDDASDSNATLRENAAATILDPLEILRQLNAPGSEVFSIEEAHVGPPSNQTNGINVANQTTNTGVVGNKPMTQSGPIGQGGDEGSVFSKRDIDAYILINSYDHPITTSRGNELVPITNVNAQAVKVMAARAAKYAYQRYYAANTPYYESSQFYNFTYGSLTLSATAFGRAIQGNEVFNWHDFRSLAMSLWNDTRDHLDSQKGRVGTVNSADNQTEFAEWAVTWSDAVVEIDEDKGDCLDFPGERRKMKRELVGEGAAEAEVQDTGLERRGPGGQTILPIGNTGYKIIMQQGTKTAFAFLYHAVVDYATMGLEFVGSEGFKENSCWKEMHYLPKYMSQYIEQGLHFVTVNGKSVTEKSIVEFAKVLKKWSETTQGDTWSTSTRTVNSMHGTVIDPNGKVFAHWGWGEFVEQTRAAVQVMLPGADDVLNSLAGLFAISHDEL